jgi:hypothetical protein
LGPRLLPLYPSSIRRMLGLVTHQDSAMQKNKPVTTPAQGEAKPGLPVSGGVVNKMEDTAGAVPGNAKTPGQQQSKEKQKR